MEKSFLFAAVGEVKVLCIFSPSNRQIDFSYCMSVYTHTHTQREREKETFTIWSSVGSSNTCLGEEKRLTWVWYHHHHHVHNLSEGGDYCNSRLHATEAKVKDKYVRNMRVSQV